MFCVNKLIAIFVKYDRHTTNLPDHKTSIFYKYIHIYPRHWRPNQTKAAIVVVRTIPLSLLPGTDYTRQYILISTCLYISFLITKKKCKLFVCLTDQHWALDLVIKSNNKNKYLTETWLICSSNPIDVHRINRGKLNGSQRMFN